MNMPFVIKEHRIEIRRLGPIACQDVGDMCFFFYDKMVEKWKQTPRWTTAHGIYRDFCIEQTDRDFWNPTIVLATVFPLEDIKTAVDLAWQVFFQKFVMPYEDQKIIDNGDIQ
jgi:hypothetical protein